MRVLSGMKMYVIVCYRTVTHTRFEYLQPVHFLVQITTPQKHITL